MSVSDNQVICIGSNNMSPKASPVKGVAHRGTQAAKTLAKKFLVKTPPGAAPAEDQAPQVDVPKGVNAALFEKVHQAVLEIKSHPIFEGIDTAMPLAIKEGGNQTPFDKKDFKNTMQQRKPYRFGGSLFMQNILWVANHRTPVNKRKIKDMGNFWFPYDNPPDVFPFDVVMCCGGEEENIQETWGAIERVSPEEPCHVALLSCQEAIQKKCSDDVLRRYRTMFLSVPCVLEAIPVGDDRYWRSINLREEIAQKFQTLVRSLRDRIYEVAGFKLDQEKARNTTLSSEKVAGLYDKNVKYAKGTERVSKSFVDTALTTFSRVFSVQTIADLLEWCDENMDYKAHPLQSIYCFQAIVDRAKTKDGIEWAFEGLIDEYRMQFINISHFSVPKLKDQRESHVEVLNLKNEVKKRLLGSWVRELGIPEAHANKACEVFKDHKTVRTMFNSYPGEAHEANLDVTWMAPYPPSSVLTFEFIDAAIYGNEFHGRYKDALRTRATVDDFLLYPTIATKIAAISEALTWRRRL